MKNFKDFLMKWRKLGFKEKRHKLPRHVHTLAQIEIDKIKICGVKGIILDLDNTIVSEDDRYLSP
ncbi:YqeG family HAD IIIA-type phosphatase, partial [Nostoc sp. CCCryo 231-06]|nr:YqeG family HAD IIIA-type phosphatase [Nostoc sp. CCCryo 231-06]